MKRTATSRLLCLLFLMAGTTTINTVSAQCAATSSPTYSSSCSDEYFTTISASGTSVISTISLTGGTCGAGQYFNDYATQASQPPQATQLI